MFTRFRTIVAHIKPPYRQWICAAALAPLLAAVHYVAYWLRFDTPLPRSAWQSYVAALPWIVLVKLATFAAFRVLQGWSSYVTFRDLVTLAKAATVSSLLFALGDYLFRASYDVPRSVFLMDWGVTIVAVGALRSVSRLIAERETPPFLGAPDKTPVFILGTSDTAEALLRNLRLASRLPYRVVGFIAERQQASSSRIGGIPVLGSLPDTCRLAKEHGVSEVLIVSGELPGRDVRQLTDQARKEHVSVRVLPSYEQLLQGHVDLRPRTVSIEDLLRREPVKLDLRQLHGWLDGQVLLVTGASGSIGSEICRQLLTFEPARLIVVDRSETGQFFLERELRRLAPHTDIQVLMADITDERRMETIFETYRPAIVFHAAAYKHVPLMEHNVGEAVKNIACASRRLADLADRQGVRSFVMISTDKAVNPTSVMGTCKRVAELYVQSLAERSECRFVTVRFGNVLDSAGSVIPIFREQIAAGGPVTVTHPEMRRFFMTIPEASQLVIQAGAMGNGGEIFVLDMGEPVRIVDLAVDMIRLSGLRLGEDIDIQFVGKRPGEKLYEELHVSGETHLPTTHPKIMIAQCERHAPEQVVSALDQFERLADGPTLPLLALLKRTVPQYQVALPAVERRAA